VVHVQALDGERGEVVDGFFLPDDVADARPTRHVGHRRVHRHDVLQRVEQGRGAQVHEKVDLRLVRKDTSAACGVPSCEGHRPRTHVASNVEKDNVTTTAVVVVATRRQGCVEDGANEVEERFFPLPIT